MVGAGGTASQFVQCPVGLKLFGGGADSVSGQIGGLLNSARPVDGGDQNTKADDAYGAWAYNSTGSPGETVVWAVCGPPGSRVRTETANLPRQATKAAKADCPDGSRVVGGGAFVTGEIPDAQLKGTRPFDDGDAGRTPDDGWLARASNIGPELEEVAATAVCRANLAPAYFGSLGGLSITEGGAGDSCPDPPNPATSVSGAGGEIRGRDRTVRSSAVMPDDNSIEAGTVPDDGVVVQAQNFSGQEARYGPFGVRLSRCRREKAPLPGRFRMTGA